MHPKVRADSAKCLRQQTQQLPQTVKTAGKPTLLELPSFLFAYIQEELDESSLCSVRLAYKVACEIATQVQRERILAFNHALASGVPYRIAASFGLPLPSAGEHSAVVVNNGKAFSFGADFKGELGVGHQQESNSRCCWYASPRRVEGSLRLKHVLSASAGRHHTLFVTEDGDAWFSGGVDYHRNGFETSETRARAQPERICQGLLGVQIADVAAGTDHSVFLSSLGSVYTFGNSAEGALGHGEDTSHQNTPREVECLRPSICGAKITSIAAGHRITLARDEKGRLWTCGPNWKHGAVTGHGGIGITATPVIVEIFRGLYISQISAGFSHALVVDRNGNLWAWGHNDCCQLGVGDKAFRGTPTPIPQITPMIGVAAGACHSMALGQDNNVYAWGHRSYIGQGSMVLKTTRNGLGMRPAALPFSQKKAIARWQNQPFPQQIFALLGQQIVHVIASSFCSIMVSRSGRIFALGYRRERPGVRCSCGNAPPEEYSLPIGGDPDEDPLLPYRLTLPQA